MNAGHQNVPWVLLRVRSRLFAVPAIHVREMSELPAVTKVPNTPAHVLGLISLRGRIVPTIDLRTRLGFPTALDDRSRFLQNLDREERTHLEVFSELSRSLDRGISIDRDCCLERCPLTSWLQATKADDLGRTGHLVKLEPSHFGLHVLMAQAVEEAGHGRGPEGSLLLRQGHAHELAEFQTALAGIRERISLSHQQIAVVLDWQGRCLAVTVDEVESIERLKNDSIEDLPPIPQGLVSDLTRQVGKRVRDDAVVMIMDVAPLFAGPPSSPGEQDVLSGVDLALSALP